MPDETRSLGNGSPELAALINGGQLWRGQEQARIRTEPTGHKRLDAWLPGGGWPKAALSEVLHAEPGTGELGLVLPLLAQLTQAEQHIAFINPPLVPYAPGLLQRGVALDYVLVVQPHHKPTGQPHNKTTGQLHHKPTRQPQTAVPQSTSQRVSDRHNESLWAAEQLLRAGYAAVLVWADAASPQALRRLQLAAEESGGQALLFRSLKRASEPSPAALRMAVRRESSLGGGSTQVQVLKSRGGSVSRAIALNS